MIWNIIVSSNNNEPSFINSYIYSAAITPKIPGYLRFNTPTPVRYRTGTVHAHTSGLIYRFTVHQFGTEQFKNLNLPVDMLLYNCHNKYNSYNIGGECVREWGRVGGQHLKSTHTWQCTCVDLICVCASATCVFSGRRIKLVFVIGNRICRLPYQML